MQKRSLKVAHGGFTLVEVVVATIIVGIAVTALVTGVASATRVNGQSQKLTTAVFLAQELREWTLRLPFDSLTGGTYAPPIDGTGAAMTDRPGWSETVTLSWRSSDNLSAVVTAGSSDVVYVQVEVFFQGNSMMKTGWLVARRIAV